VFLFALSVLILTERSLDLAVPLHHSWTYQALLHDLLDMKANRIKLQVLTTQNQNICFRHRGIVWKKYFVASFEGDCDSTFLNINQMTFLREFLFQIEMSICFGFASLFVLGRCQGSQGCQIIRSCQDLRLGQAR
jgi:hypothetical protein